MHCPPSDDEGNGPNRPDTRVWARKAAVEELRNAVASVQQQHPAMTLSWAIERGLRLVRQELEAYFNQGRTFPEREGRLREGRPARPREGELGFEEYIPSRGKKASEDDGV